MLNLNQIQQQYRPKLHSRPRFLLREYLQYKMLAALSQQAAARQLVFMGGTAIRLIYNSQRFSEDLDFDNLSLSQDDFKQIVQNMQRQLKLEGIELETTLSFKAAFHAHFKFPGLLQKFNLTKQKKEKILIRFDAAPQDYTYQPDLKIINKFDVFARVAVVPPQLLLSQKILTALQRKRAKGRDFYDIVFLSAQFKPDLEYFKQKADIHSEADLKQALLKKSDSLDFDKLAQDVAPFLMEAADQERVRHFVQFVRQEF